MLPTVVLIINVRQVRHRHRCTRLCQTGNVDLLEETKVDNSVLENFRTTGWPNIPVKWAKKVGRGQNEILTI